MLGRLVGALRKQDGLATSYDLGHGAGSINPTAVALVTTLLDVIAVRATKGWSYPMPGF